MNVGALRKVTSMLNEMNVPYTVFGGVAAVYYDMPRMTFDVDILVPCLKSPQAKKLSLRLHKADPSLKPAKIEKTLKQGGAVRIGWGGTTVVDLVVKKGVKTILDRTVEVEGIKIISLEDLILQKLSLIRAASREPGMVRPQDREDVAVLLTVHKKDIDLEYMKKEAKKAGTLKLLNGFLAKVSKES